MILAPELARRRMVSPIRLLHAEGGPWRVAVEAWPGRDGWQGRFVFEPSRSTVMPVKREGPVRLRGATPEDLVADAHDVPEARLRALLWSLA